MSIKIVFLGPANVGKTSLIQRISKGCYTSNCPATSAAAFTQKKAIYEGKEFDVGIWDTAGSEQYKSIAPMYFRNASVGFVVADAAKPELDFQTIEWVHELKNKGKQNVKVVIVINKEDLIVDKESLDRRGQAMSAEFGGSYILTSALTGKGVDKMLEQSFGLIKEEIMLLETSEEDLPLNIPPEKLPSKCC